MTDPSPAAVIAPDHRAVLAHLATAEFREGLASGRWRIVSLDWPTAVVAVAAAPRDSAPDEFGLRIDLSGFPQQCPTTTPWDLEGNVQLAADKRPSGEYAGTVFRADWESGRALYAPYDRVALVGHPSWSTQHPADVWHPQRTLSFLLDRVHTLLNDEAYEGVV